MSPGNDIIGDIHGRATALRDVLAQLGYVEDPKNGYAHPRGRKVIFLGDFIDRGPQQQETLDIVREMTDSGNARAVKGNHEFNAICYATPDGQGDYVRPHTDYNTNTVHGCFLKEFPFGSPAHEEMIEWFRTLPVFIEQDEFRIVHACWDDRSLADLAPWLDGGNRLIAEAYDAYGRREQPLRAAIDTLLMGPEHELPAGMSYSDPQGKVRTAIRHLWWRAVTLQAEERLNVTFSVSPEDVERIRAQTRLRADFTSAAKPTFVGHYGLVKNGHFETSQTVAVLDYRGQVTAYRHETGDTVPEQGRFVFGLQ